MRILILADTFPTANSGAAGTDLLGAEALRRAGHHVDCVWADQLPHRVQHYNLRYLTELPLAYRRIVAARLARTRYDVVQISQPHGYLAAALVDKVYPRSIFVHRSHGLEARVARDLEPWRTAFAAKRPLFKRILSGAMARMLDHNNRLIAAYAHGHLVSASQCKNYLSEVYQIPATAVAAIAQGIPDSYLAESPPVAADRLHRLLHVGQCAFVKGDIVLGRVVTDLLESNPSATFSWVCAAEHHAVARSYFGSGVLDRVQFVNNMDQQELRAIYDSHGVFLFPSFFEGFGKAFLEAMSRSMVVVASDEGGMRDVIVDEINGYKVPTGSVSAMVHAVEAIWQTPQKACSVARAAAQAAGVYTWDRFANESTTFYTGLLASRRGCPPPFAQ